MTTEATVNSLIDNAIAIAYQQAGVANGEIASVQAALGWQVNDLDPPPPPVGTVVPPEFDKPVTEDSSVAYRSDYDATAAALTAQLAGTFNGFLAEHFPSMDQYTEAVDSWINNTITNGGTGVPADIEAQIWQRGRDKEALEASRLSYEAVGAFAARGFMLPPGAMAGRLIEVQQDAANKNSSFGRDVAIKQIEIEIENIKFAVKTAVEARIAGIAAAIEYWKAYLLPHKIAADRAGAIVDAKLKFSQALASWYSAEASVYGTEVNQLVHFWSARTEAYKANATAIAGLANARGNAAAAGAKAAADIAAAAMSAMNTLAQVGYSEDKSL